MAKKKTSTNNPGGRKKTTSSTPVGANAGSAAGGDDAMSRARRPARPTPVPGGGTSSTAARGGAGSGSGGAAASTRPQPSEANSAPAMNPRALAAAWAAATERAVVRATGRRSLPPNAFGLVMAAPGPFSLGSEGADGIIPDPDGGAADAQPAPAAEGGPSRRRGAAASALGGAPTSVAAGGSTASPSASAASLAAHLHYTSMLMAHGRVDAVGEAVAAERQEITHRIAAFDAELSAWAEQAASSAVGPGTDRGDGGGGGEGRPLSGLPRPGSALAATGAAGMPLRGLFDRGDGGREAKPALRILAEGDSWFDFPLGGRPLRGSDVIDQLGKLIDYPILNLATRGHEARAILGAVQYHRLEELLLDPRRDFNVLLFSGGGNDFVGDAFRLYIRDRDDPKVQGDPAKALNATFDHLMQTIAAAYEELVALRDRVVAMSNAARGGGGAGGGGGGAVPAGRRITIYVHGYDFAIPSGRGTCGFGPWLAPSLRSRGWVNPQTGHISDTGTTVVRHALRKFADLLTDLAQRHPDFVVVPTQGTLPDADLWRDELHPTPEGFRMIAEKFAAALAQHPAVKRD